MAIQPQFAQGILNGKKRIEFRKRPLAPDVDVVLIYESAPTQRIVGQFTIARTEQASPLALWRRFRSVGGIARADYLDYYRGSSGAVGFLITDVERYSRPVMLQELSARPAVPQSFTYLPASTMREVQAMQSEGVHGWEERVLDLARASIRSLARVGGG